MSFFFSLCKTEGLFLSCGQTFESKIIFDFVQNMFELKFFSPRERDLFSKIKCFETNLAVAKQIFFQIQIF